jgi:hypothetical protein
VLIAFLLADYMTTLRGAPRRTQGVKLRLWLIAGMAVALGVGACGESDEPTAIAEVRECLEDAGMEVLEAHPEPDDDDAPDRGELLTTGAFLGFYSSSDRADELAVAVRENVPARGDVARYGDVTVLYLPEAERDTIENCVES